MEIWILIGAVVGGVMGLLGGGGTVLLLPLLVYVGSMSPHAAIGTSLVVVGLGALAATVQHARAGRVRWRVGLNFGFAAMLGAFPGGWVAQFVSGTWLMVGFAMLMMVAGLVMLRPRKELRQRDEPVAWYWIWIEGVLVGFFTGLVGAGGGFMIVPALVLLGGLDMKEAVGTSLFIMSMKSVAALAGQLTHVELDWSLVIVVSMAAIVGSTVGAFVTRWVSAQRLRMSFAILVVLLAVHTMGQELNGI